jgi:glyoxylase-like metal-dependent hydrolase (beta-lactamase superfamily II)
MTPSVLGLAVEERMVMRIHSAHTLSTSVAQSRPARRTQRAHSKDFIRFVALVFVFLSALAVFSLKNAFAEPDEPLSDKIILLRASVTNCFLVTCKEGYLLIDVPYTGEYGSLKEALKEKNVDVSEIQYLLLTHHHDDHAGCVNELLKETDARIIVHEQALPHLAAGRSNPDGEPINFCTGAVMKAYGLMLHDSEFKFPPVHLRENDMVITGDDDELLRRIGIEGKIIHTPGHTADSISVILDDGSALVGDAAMNFMKYCLIGHKPIYAEDRKQTSESWKKLKEHGAKFIYPAHGDPFAAEELVPFE